MSRVMTIECLKHGYNFEDLEYVSTYVKGKKKNPQLDDYRFLVKGKKTGKEMVIFFMLKRGLPFGKFLEYFEPKFVDQARTRIRNKSYNYYYFNNDPQSLHDAFQDWKNSDPLVSTGGFIHQTISNIVNYQGSYRFEGVVY